MNLRTEYEALARAMLQTYTEAEQTMLGRIRSRLGRGIDSPGWTKAKYAEIQQVRQELERTIKGLSQWRETVVAEAMEKAFENGSQAFMADNLSLNLTPISPNTKKVARILSELLGSLRAADRLILRKANDTYADVIGLATGRVATGTVTVRQAVQSALDDFADKGISSFIDRGGSAWEMGTYAEMAILTGIGRASLYGYTETMQAYGYDLAIISSHEGACPLCVAWESVIISVSGSDDRFPSLAEAEDGGCFHPRCLHHISTYYEGISPEGRSSPRPVERPSGGYSARSAQRHAERNIRKWKRRMAVATDAQAERYAYNHVRKWQAKIRNLLDENASENLPRKYWREGGRQNLRLQKK